MDMKQIMERIIAEAHGINDYCREHFPFEANETTIVLSADLYLSILAGCGPDIAANVDAQTLAGLPVRVLTMSNNKWEWYISIRHVEVPREEGRS
jgi:hypothetical protein